MKKIAITAALTLALAGCAGGGPGKADIEQALAQFFEQAAGVRTTFEDLQVGTCEKAGDTPGYACSVSATAVLQTGSRAQREPLSRTFVFDEVGGRWKVVSTR